MEKEEKVRQAQERAKEVRTLDIKEIKKRMQKIRKSFDMNQEDFFSVIFPEKENAFMENQTGTAETKKQKRPKKASSKQSYISKIENRKSPKIDDLERYAAAGGVSLEWLLYGKAEKGNKSDDIFRPAEFCRMIANAMERLNLQIVIDDPEPEIYIPECRISFLCSDNYHTATANALLEIYNFRKENLPTLTAVESGNDEQLKKLLKKYMKEKEEHIIDGLPPF